MPIIPFVFIANKLIKSVILPSVGAVIRTMHSIPKALRQVSRRNFMPLLLTRSLSSHKESLL